MWSDDDSVDDPNFDAKSKDADDTDDDVSLCNEEEISYDSDLDEILYDVDDDEGIP